MDGERQPLASPAVAGSALWRHVEVVDRTGSTNSDLLASARDGAAEGLVLVAEEQTAGRGRLGRTWVAPPFSSLMFSVLLRPGPQAPQARWGWLPLLAGVAVSAAVREVTGVPAVLKWPNDVLAGSGVAGGGKLAGILAEAEPAAAGTGAVVLGIGLNVSTRLDEFPPPLPGAQPPASLVTAGAVLPDRGRLLAAILTGIERRYLSWRQAAGDPAVLRAGYMSRCATIGRDIRVELPGGRSLAGVAVGIDAEGRLLVRPPDGAGPAAVAAGDVIHVR